MFRILWRLVRFLLIVIAVIVAIPVVGLLYGFATTDEVTLPPVPQGADMQHRAEVRAGFTDSVAPWLRNEDNTFLTYPEWSIVYAARDYAHHLETGRESGFPYFAYTGLYWQDYARAIRATADYPFNGEYQTMLAVIGTSQTIEYVIQGLWENTIGRVTELLSPGGTPQDALRAEGARDYAAMLDRVPWFEYPYAQARADLWQSPSAPGVAAIRSWERKLAFALSDSIKTIYARLIKSGLQASSGETELDIAVWAEGPVANAIAGEKDTRMHRDLGEDGAVFVTRRYQVFTEMVPRLIARGVRFVEIAGNTRMQVTLLSSGPVGPPPGTAVLFANEIPARPGLWRTGLVVPVAHLHEILPQLQDSGTELEHIYDY